MAICVLAGTESAGEDGPGEAGRLPAMSAATVASLDGAPKAVGPPPPLQPVTTPPAATTASA